jgi:hypothetical protein
MYLKIISKPIKYYKSIDKHKKLCNLEIIQARQKQIIKQKRKMLK